MSIIGLGGFSDYFSYKTKSGFERFVYMGTMRGGKYYVSLDRGGFADQQTINYFTNKKDALKRFNSIKNRVTK